MLRTVDYKLIVFNLNKTLRNYQYSRCTPVPVIFLKFPNNILNMLLCYYLII